MILFLTSSPCVIGAPRAILNPANDFVKRIKAVLPKWPRVLFVCSNPDDHEMTCSFASDFQDAFREVGIRFGGFSVLDGTNGEDAEYLVATSDLIILSGGHLPTQNRFLMEIGMREILQGYEGVVMGISAGSMNCADIVYAQPEEEGESVDPDYERFVPGLGLTDVNILPHYQQVKNYILDGRRLYEDITFEDSMDNEFFAFPDGTYLYCDEDECVILGKAYRLSNGIFEQLTRDGGRYDLD